MAALRTADAVTPTLTVPAVMASLIIFVVVYLIIFSFGTLYVYRLLRAGPVDAAGRVLQVNPKRPLAVGDTAIPEIAIGGGGT